MSLIPRVITINFRICPKDFSKVVIVPSFRPPTKGFTDQFRGFVKDWRGCSYDEEDKVGQFPLEFYEARRTLLRRDLSNKYKGTEININNFNPLVLKCVRKSDEELKAEKQKEQNVEDSMKQFLPENMQTCLKDYQRDAVKFFIMKNGRCLIGDEMGLGKTFESISCYKYYSSFYKSKGHENFPLLIICPSSLRIQWSQELQKWIPGDFSNPDESILVVLKGKDLQNFKNQRVMIISYDLASKNINLIQSKHFAFAIVDECHMLKNAEAKRTKTIGPLLRSVRHVCLLSGTPALARPKEMFSQISIINSELFPRFHDFGVRYCNGHELPFKVPTKSGVLKTAWDYNGASNLSELNIILSEFVMIRRQKEHVLKDLPEKMREKVYLDVPMGKRLKSKMQDIREKMQENLEKARKSKSEDSTIQQDDQLSKSILLMYQLMSKAKSAAVCKYIEEFFEYNSDPNEKFLIFGHHKDLLDKIAEVLEKKVKCGYFRIDGSTSAEKRQEYVNKFQEDDNKDFKVGLLSMTAAGVGLTLTKATKVIFVELNWTPGILDQAEARAHRLGQTKKVLIQYLVGKDTMEEDMWTKLDEKIDVVSTILDNTSEYKRKNLEAVEIEVGQKRLKLEKIKK